MDNFIGQRIRQLRTHYNMGMKDFAELSGLSHVAIFHLENGKTRKPHKSSMHRIAATFGTTTEWILYGSNEMLPNGKRDTTELKSEAFWKEESYLELKKRNLILEEEVGRLWNIITHLTNGQFDEAPI